MDTVKGLTSINMKTPFTPTSVPVWRQFPSLAWDAGAWFIPIGIVIGLLGANHYTAGFGRTVRGENLIPGTIAISSMFAFFASGLSIAFDGKRRWPGRIHDWAILRPSNIAFSFCFAGAGYGIGLFISGFAPRVPLEWRFLGYAGCCLFFGFYVFFMHHGDVVWSQRPLRSKLEAILMGGSFALLGLTLMFGLVFSIRN